MNSFVDEFETNKTDINVRFGLRDDMRINESIKLDKSLLSSPSLRVIGQLDNKFIICVAKDRNLLLAFDQHAVHERIRYENILNDVFDDNKNIKTIPLLPPIDITLDFDELREDFAFYGKQIKCLIGFEVKQNNSKLNQYFVSQIPECLNHSLDLDSMKAIIKEAIIIVKQKTNTNNGITGTRLTPKLMERLQTKACKGAIRFGDSLKLHDCLKLISCLSKCNVCFRCAHGRASVAPLAYLPTKFN